MLTVSLQSTCISVTHISVNVRTVTRQPSILVLMYRQLQGNLQCITVLTVTRQPSISVNVQTVARQPSIFKDPLDLFFLSHFHAIISPMPCKMQVAKLCFPVICNGMEVKKCLVTSKFAANCMNK